MGRLLRRCFWEKCRSAGKNLSPSLTEYVDKKAFPLYEYIVYEKNEQEKLLSEKDTKGRERVYSTLLRQSAFFEHYLSLQIKSEYTDMVNRSLEREETKDIESFGHQNRIRFSHILGIITEEERETLLEMADQRNRISHEPWHKFEKDQDKTERIVRDVLSILSEWT